jgi:hypothetical protein
MNTDHQTVNSLKKITKNGRTKHAAQHPARGAGINRCLQFWVDCGGTMWCDLFWRELKILKSRHSLMEKLQ